MRRGSNDMQVNVAGIRRNIKNFAHNYSDAQKKVREATSNDPWGPSSTIMAEIADLTYNVVAFSEIMHMVWKRLNDHGRNWRHVYKALVLLEYLIKTGSEKVGQQCKENIFAIQTLKDFQYLEEGKDQGQNVREKAKQLVNLLKDDDRLKNERTRALKAKERFAQSASGFGSDGGLDTPCSPKYPSFRGDWNSSRDSNDLPREIENARPQTAGEEELQLQLALAMSREEAEQEEHERKSDDVRLQLALSQSQHDFRSNEDKIKVDNSHMVDLLEVNLGDTAVPNTDPWGMPQPPRPQQTSPWQPNALSTPPPIISSTAGSGDPWQPLGVGTNSKPDPWGGILNSSTSSSSPLQNIQPTKQDPWSPTSHGSSTDLDDFDLITNRNRAISPKASNGTNGTTSDPFELNLLGDTLTGVGVSPSTGATKKTPQSFLGENSALVNLDNLVSTTKPVNSTLPANPFSDTQPSQPHQQLQQQQQQQQQQRPMFNTPIPKQPTINEMKQASIAQFATQSTTFGSGSISSYSVTATSQPFGGMPMPNTQDPWAPAANNNTPWTKNGEQANPFLS